MGRVPLDQVEAFVAAARLGNLTRAAAQMHLTVSALSHRMRLLEERLGQRLLARGPRGVELTVEGRACTRRWVRRWMRSPRRCDAPARATGAA